MSAGAGAGETAAAPPLVVIYERPGCHLCEDALAAIERARREVSFELQRVDIETDDALFKRYLERIPVVAINGDEAFQYFVDTAEFTRHIRARNLGVLGFRELESDQE